MLAVACILELCRSDKEYFDYQIYKVENLHEESSASKVNIMFQEEHGGNSQKLLTNGQVSSALTSQTSPGKIRRNRKDSPLWKERGIISEGDELEEAAEDGDFNISDDLPLGIVSQKK